jgi:hypothetical protein
MKHLCCSSKQVEPRLSLVCRQRQVQRMVPRQRLSLMNRTPRQVKQVTRLEYGVEDGAAKVDDGFIKVWGGGAGEDVLRKGLVETPALAAFYLHDENVNVVVVRSKALQR